MNKTNPFSKIFDLHNKVIVLTGSSGRLGTEYSEFLSQAGAQLVLIDKNSMEFINESELDYKDELIGSSFSITNPNAKNSCGCGTSFSV